MNRTETLMRVWEQLASIQADIARLISEEAIRSAEIFELDRGIITPRPQAPTFRVPGLEEVAGRAARLTEPGQGGGN